MLTFTSVNFLALHQIASLFALEKNSCTCVPIILKGLEYFVHCRIASSFQEYLLIKIFKKSKDKKYFFMPFLENNFKRSSTNSIIFGRSVFNFQQFRNPQIVC